MNATITFHEQRRVAERRGIDDRRNPAERRKAAKNITHERERAGRRDHALDLLGSVLAVAASVVVLVLTGLFEGAQSAAVQITLIAAIVYAYVVAFRRAFYS